MVSSGCATAEAQAGLAGVAAPPITSPFAATTVSVSFGPVPCFSAIVSPGFSVVVVSFAAAR